MQEKIKTIPIEVTALPSVPNVILIKRPDGGLTAMTVSRFIASIVTSIIGESE